MTDHNQETMRAFVLKGHGGQEQLEYRNDWPKPRANKGQVLIRVRACGLNNTDINTRVAWYSKSATGATGGESAAGSSKQDAAWGGKPISFPRIQGADVCGVVEQAEDRDLIGKRVMIDTWLRDWDDPDNLNKTGYFGSECDGGFAEYVAIDARQVHPLECDLQDAEIATFATSWSTAENMLARADVGDGDTVLISGASGGVGSALLQLAKLRGAATVIGMCGEDKQAQVRAAGADVVLPRAPGDLRAALSQAGVESVSVVADLVGGEGWPDMIDVLARGGRYVCSGAIAGAQVPLDLRPFYLRNLTFYGSTVIPPGMFATLVRRIEKGEVRPLLAATYPLSELKEAQQAFLAKKHVGNIVVVM